MGELQGFWVDGFARGVCHRPVAVAEQTHG